MPHSDRRRPTTDVALAAAATVVWAEDKLVGADASTTLADGKELLIGRIAFAADRRMGQR